MYAKRAGGSSDRFGAHRNCYSAREAEIWLRHVYRTFCAYSRHRKAAFCTPKQEERLLIRFCRTNAYIYSTVGISTKISHQPIFIFISLRHFSSSPWWIDLLSSTVRSSMSMMTGNKPRQISHLHLSILRFAKAHDCHCRGRYTVEVDIDPSHNISVYHAPNGCMLRSSL